MADGDDRLQFSFELIDKVSDTATQIGTSAEEADRRVEDFNATAEDAVRTSKTLDSSLQATQVNLVTQMSAIGSLDGAVNAVRGGLEGLGLVSEETSEKLAKVSAGFSLIKGTAQGLVAVKALMSTLNAQTAINAALSSYLAVLKNPAMLAGVGLAAGAAAGIAGAYLMTNNNTTTNTTTNITVQDTTPKQATGGIIKVFEGGAL